MALAKMSVAELERFLRDEFPQAFSGDDIKCGQNYMENLEELQEARVAQCI